MVEMNEFALPATSFAPEDARRQLRALIPPLPPNVEADIKLLTTEIVSNAIRHAPLDPSSDNVIMRVETPGGAIRVEVLNPGPPFDPSTPVQPSDMQDSGYGLYLVDTIATRWGVDQDDENDDPWTKVWFEIEPATGGHA